MSLIYQEINTESSYLGGIDNSPWVLVPQLKILKTWDEYCEFKPTYLEYFTDAVLALDVIFIIF